MLVSDLVSIKWPQIIQTFRRFQLSGGDTIWGLVPDQDGTFSIGGEITQPTGSGPRHVAIYMLTTVHQPPGTVTSQLILPEGQNNSDPISNLLIVPEDQAAEPGANFAAAEVLISSPI